MADWYPGHIPIAGKDSGSFITSYPKRGVLHTTEGSSLNGAISAYKTNNSWPHFTVSQQGLIYQHLPLSRAARALENRSGGVETNRAGAIQIEVIGFAAQPVWSQVQLEAVRKLMRWIEAQTGIKPIAPPFGGPEQYGLKNALEMTNATWNIYNGWCGHQHVPENSHWDPGAINFSKLLPEATMPDPPVYPAKAKLQSFVPVVINDAVVGYYMITEDGEVFGFGAVPYFGRIDTAAIP